MLRVLGSSKRLCDGLNRREMLNIGSLSAMGLGLHNVPVLQAAAGGLATARSPGFAKAKSVILLFLYGGASQLETFDPKPEAPLEIRGTIGSIPTSIPGCRISEGLPNVAQLMDRVTVIRSMTHPYPIHGTAFSVTSTPTLDGTMQDNPQDPRHWPFIGSVVDYLDTRRERKGDGRSMPSQSVGQRLPRNIGVPFLHSSRRRDPRMNAGPYAAFLGRSFDPLWTEFEGEALHTQKYHFGSVISTVADPYGGVKPGCRFLLGHNATLRADVTRNRFSRRRTLLEQLDRVRSGLDSYDSLGGYDASRREAFSILTGNPIREAIDVSREPDPVRQRYGMSLFGQSCLLARRMIEAGGRFVTVFWDEFGSVNSAWDTHYGHFPRMTQQLLPGFDRAYSALLNDLEERGLLDETLVICTTEHGRTPKLDPDGDHPSGRGQGGRNHWSQAYSTVLAGAGIAKGRVVGRTDRIAGEVASTPVSPKDILTTTYHLLGIDPHTTIPDRAGRPVPIGGNGRVLEEVLA